MEKKKTKGKTAPETEENAQTEQANPEQNAAQASAAQEGTAAGEVSNEEKLERELNRARAEAEDYKRKWYSVSAEYENYRKRTARESAQRYSEGRADVVRGLFPIADNLERALAACKDEATRKGVAMVLDAFGKLLEAEKITAIDPAGEPFDAEKHEAIMAVDPAEGEESGTVREVYLKGYEKDGKVLRFAQVVVTR